MTTDNWISLGAVGVAVLSLIVSIGFGVFNSIVAGRAANRAENANTIASGANQLSQQANAISREANMLAAGDSETAMRSEVRAAWHMVEQVRIEISGITNGRPPAKLNADEKRLLASAESGLRFAIEQVCNAYEAACRRYIDGKCEKVGFRKLFHDEIRTLVQNNTDSFKEVLRPGPASKYQAILKVYDEWHNIEKGS